MQKDLMSQSFEDKQMARQIDQWKSYQDCFMRFFCFSVVFLTNALLDRLKKWHSEAGSIPSNMMTDACHVVWQKTCYLDY